MKISREQLKNLFFTKKRISQSSLYHLLDSVPNFLDDGYVTGFVFRGPWLVGEDYIVNDTVTYNGETYACILPSTGDTPTDTTYWTKLVEKGQSMTIAIGTVESGVTASVTDVGTPSAAVLNFVLPKGDKGDTGDKTIIYSTVGIPDNGVGNNGDWAFDTSSNSNVYYKESGSWSLINSNKGVTGDTGASIVSAAFISDDLIFTKDDTNTVTVVGAKSDLKGDKGDTGDKTMIYSTVGLPDNGIGSNGDWAFDTSVDGYVYYKALGVWGLVNSLRGPAGNDGADGQEIELQKSVTHLQWRYVDGTWIDLISLAEITGPKGDTGDGDVNGPASNTADYIPQWDGANSKTLKNGIPTSTFEPAKGTDDNYVTDAEKTVIGNTSGTNSGDNAANTSCIAKSLVDAKGDILTATANDTPARLALGTNDYVLTADSSTATGLKWAAPAAGGASLWTAPAGATRVSNTTFTVTGDQTAIFKKGMIIKWAESSTVRCAMVSIPSTVSTDTTVTIIGDTMASIDSGSLKYCLIGVEGFIKEFVVAGTIGATATDVSRAYYATEPMRVLGADISVGTAGTTNNTTVDLNKNGTTMFTTKPTLATTVASSPLPFTADTTSALALGDRLSLDIDAIQGTASVDLYCQLYLFPSRYLTLS